MQQRKIQKTKMLAQIQELVLNFDGFSYLLIIMKDWKWQGKSIKVLISLSITISPPTFLFAFRPLLALPAQCKCRAVKRPVLKEVCVPDGFGLCTNLPVMLKNSKAFSYCN